MWRILDHQSDYQLFKKGSCPCSYRNHNSRRKLFRSAYHDVTRVYSGYARARGIPTGLGRISLIPEQTVEVSWIFSILRIQFSIMNRRCERGKQRLVYCLPLSLAHSDRAVPTCGKPSDEDISRLHRERY